MACDFDDFTYVQLTGSTKRTYSYSPLNQLLTITEGLKTTTFTYDDIGRQRTRKWSITERLVTLT